MFNGHINLENLLLYEGHYTLIKSTAVLVYKQIISHNEKLCVWNCRLIHCEAISKFLNQLRFL